MNVKKRILMLTSIYVGDDIPKTITRVVHYFAKEWVKTGHEILVIHNQAIYPRIFYRISAFFGEFIASKVGFSFPTKRHTMIKEYTIDDVQVRRIPIFKLIPHKKYSNSVLESHLSKIISVIKGKEFLPDVIVGHWSNPQLWLINKLKDEFEFRSCIVMHDNGNSIPLLFKDYKSIINSVDVWGYRSAIIKKQFESNFGQQKKTFLCYSGIPEKYLLTNSPKHFGQELSSFLFVGNLIKRKYPTSLIISINKVYKNRHFKINYIGTGSEDSNIKKLIKKNKLENSVKLLGRQERKEIQKAFDQADCFIMISKNETFGLVYLEALSKGCITIASKNEGFDGIIENGVNGFLCGAGNHIELAMIINQINSLSFEEKRQISKNAIMTAKKFTDSNVAQNYLNSIINN